ncbi:hypothetical protein DH2020_005508 [Rehmannia glutinosa]|uniref:Uncharacterized protein n=1 Tax=Rehmannia glutinosa TaxID=99300 RepID=A0ABR0XG89_REHGL
MDNIEKLKNTNVYTLSTSLAPSRPVIVHTCYFEEVFSLSNILKKLKVHPSAFLKKTKDGWGSVSQRNEKTSVKHRNNPLEGAFIELANFDYANITPQGNDKCTLRNSDPQSSEMLSTADLISAVGHAWDSATRPLSVLLSKTNPTCKTEVIQGGGVLNYSTDKTFRASSSVDDQPCLHYLNSKANSSRLVQENLEHLKVKKKTSCPRPTYEFFSFWRIVLARSTVIEESSAEYCLSSTGIHSNLVSTYGWMREKACPKQKNQVKAVTIESERTSNCYRSEFSTNSGSGNVPADTNSTFNRSSTGVSASKHEIAQPLDLSFGKDLKASTMTCSENTIAHGQHIEATDCKIFASRCDLVSRDTNLASVSHDCENSMTECRDVRHEHQKDQGITFVKTDSSEVEISLSAKEKSPYALAKQEHAFAGAMAVYSSAFVFIQWTQLRRNITLWHTAQQEVVQVLLHRLFLLQRRIKQQMQIGSHYRNCWNAFIQVVQKGGVLSLYTGWGAVLCRNVPHSVIKLVCGGLAGSMASLFTTPFDVVKTRLQTQIPGSMTPYGGVFNTLTVIGKQEGLKGLYR